jgi:hypothetical protein
MAFLASGSLTLEDEKSAIDSGRLHFFVESGALPLKSYKGRLKAPKMSSAIQEVVEVVPLKMAEVKPFKFLQTSRSGSETRTGELR